MRNLQFFAGHVVCQWYVLYAMPFPSIISKMSNSPCETRGGGHPTSVNKGLYSLFDRELN